MMIRLKRILISIRGIKSNLKAITNVIVIIFLNQAGEIMGKCINLFQKIIIDIIKKRG